MIHIDLEPALLRKVRELVAGELAQDFPKAARARGEALVQERLVDGRLDGDELKATVKDKGETHKVRLTLPVFGGPTVTQCPCQKHVASSGEPRCAHVYAVHKALSAALEDAEDKELRGADHSALFDAMDDFIGVGADVTAPSAFSEEATATDGIRLVWRVDDGLDLAPFLQTRLADGPWSKGRRLGWGEFIGSPALWSTQADHLAAARVKPRRLGNQDDFEVDVFGLLEDLDGHPLVFWTGEGEESVAVEAGVVGLAVRKTDEGIVVASHINAAPVERQWIFEGKGYVTLVASPRRLLFARCNAATTAFLLKLSRSERAVPMADKERLLSYLVRLEQKLAVAISDTIVEPSRVPASELLYVRMTPMQPSGIKVELLVRPAPTGGYFPAGMGPDTVLDVTDPDQPRNVARSLDGEADRACAFVEALGIGRLPCVHGHIWFLRTDDAALDFVTALNAYAERAALAVEWPKHAQKAYEQAAPLEAQSFHIAVGEGRDWFDVAGTVDVDGQLVELKDLIEAVKRKTRYVRLKDGRWTRVTELFEKRIMKVASLLEETKSGFAIPAASIPELNALDLEKERVEILQASDDFKRVNALFKKARNMPCPLPEGFQATLRPYQQSGYEWMARLAAWGMGACLADDMGLGKTVQTLAVLMRLAGDGPSLVIAPTSVSPNWAKEARRFAPSLNVVMYRETDRDLALTKLKAGDLLLVSYGLAQRDAEKLAAVEWSALVLDEAQAVKNFHTKTAQAIRLLRANWRVALTGTPIENSLSELWSIFRIVAPGMLGPWEAFKRSYAVPIERFDKEGARSALQTRLSPFILRRLKEDYLAELPPKTEIDVAVELTDEERRLYDAVRISAMRDIETKAKKAEETGEKDDNRLAVLAALTKLRQIACHPKLFDPDWTGPASKLTAFVDICRGLKENGHRALIFSQFTSHLALLGEALRSIGCTQLYLDGSVPQKERAALVERFQAQTADFFLISVKAGGTGLTLTAADYVLHMDPWWNPAVEDQATDRAHRMGQTKPLTVYRFVASGTVEEKILQLHASKRDLVEKLLAGGARAQALSSDELLSILGYESSWEN